VSRIPTPAHAPADVRHEPSLAWSARLGGLVAAALPAGVARGRLAHDPAWREDVSVLRQIGLVGMGLGGGVSTALAQIAAALPLGTLTFRVALVSVIALAFACHFAFDIAHRLLRAANRGSVQAGSAQPAPPWVAASFACIGVVGAGLGPSFQLEATVTGGAMVATALALGAIALALRAVDASSDTARGRDIACAGVLLGATAAERVTSAAAAFAAIVLVFTVHRAAAWLSAKWASRRAPRPSRGRQRVASPPLASPRVASPRVASLRLAPVPRRAAVLAAALAGATWLVTSAPALIRPYAQGRAFDFGATLAPLPSEAAAIVSQTALGAWITEMGWTPLALAGLGALVLALRGASRPGAAALGVLVGCDALLPTHVLEGAALDAATPLRVLALGGMAIAAAVGLHEAVFRLLKARIPYARPAVALLIAFQATIVALASEQASSAADRSQQRGPEEWLDATRASLEARSALMVRATAFATRVWAAQLARGYRPDVLVIPSALLARGGVASDLLAREPRALDLVRSIALRGEADEFAMSSLADVRTLHVQSSRHWENREAAHVELDGLWLEFAPQPIGRNDRRRTPAQSVAPVARLLRVLSPIASPDVATVNFVATELREQALVLVGLGEEDTARALAGAARELGATRSLGSPAAVVLLASLEATARQKPGSGIITVRGAAPAPAPAAVPTVANVKGGKRR